MYLFVIFLFTSHRAPDPGVADAQIPVSELPKCGKCGSLVRPHVVWFGEALDFKVLQDTDNALEDCDLCLLVGVENGTR